MIDDYRCFYCYLRGVERLIVHEHLNKKDAEGLTRDVLFSSSKNYGSESGVDRTRDLNRMIQKYNGNADPYKKEKKQSNDLALGMYEEMKENVLSSDNPFETALKIAISGNIIDFAVSEQYDLKSTVDKVLTSDFGIDDSIQLKEEIQNAKKVLYLGDNNGEIVFDKLFVETIDHPNLYFAVRGAPVINDGTLEDAIYVGMDKKAKIISNGYDAPSTIPEKCSAEFQELFNSADVIISKGQGNLEGLMNRSDKRIFFLLMVKCDVVAERLGVKKGDFVIVRGNSF